MLSRSSQKRQKARPALQSGQPPSAEKRAEAQGVAKALRRSASVGQLGRRPAPQRVPSSNILGDMPSRSSQNHQQKARPALQSGQHTANRFNSNNILSQMVTATPGMAGGCNNTRIASMQDFQQTGRSTLNTPETSNLGTKAPKEGLALTRKNTSAPSKMAAARSMGRLGAHKHKPAIPRNDTLCCIREENNDPGSGANASWEVADNSHPHPTFRPVNENPLLSLISLAKDPTRKDDSPVSISGMHSLRI